MLQSDKRVTSDRLYEITDIDEGPWYTEVGGYGDVRGAVVQLDPEDSIQVTICKGNEYLTTGESHCMLGLHLRPLNNKEQRKILKCLDPAK